MKKSKSPLSNGCPCGRYGDQVSYEACCGRWQEGNAPDPESLMRSRYSAFVRRDDRYLRLTWSTDTCPDQLDLTEAPIPQWLGLEIKHTPPHDGRTGLVEFVARYKVAGRAQRLHEISRFVCEAGRWMYVDGNLLS